LLVGQIAVVAQHSLHHYAEFGANGFLNRPINRCVLPNCIDQFTGDYLESVTPKTLTALSLTSNAS
jgi:hypothetical protein